jgi:hypothetical protein
LNAVLSPEPRVASPSLPELVRSYRGLHLTGDLAKEIFDAGAAQTAAADDRDWNLIAAELGCEPTREAMLKTIRELKAPKEVTA